VGPSGSEATGWHHYDGARKITLGAVSGDDGNGHEYDAVSMPHRREEFILTPQKRPGPLAQPRLKELVNLLFAEVPSGVSSHGKVRLTKDNQPRPLVEGARWAVTQGWGESEDLTFSWT